MELQCGCHIDEIGGVLLWNVNHTKKESLGIKMIKTNSLQYIQDDEDLTIMVCQGICHRYKITKGKQDESWYKKGDKRCTTCAIYIKWEGLWCPCCGYMLRNKLKVTNTEKISKSPECNDI